MKKTTLLTTIALGISMSAFAANPTDAQITQIVETTNKGEIEMAKLAKDKSSNKEIKEFADHMILDHSANNKKADEFVSKTNMKLEMNPESKQIQKDNAATLTSMKKLNGKEFDKAYISNQISAHEKVLKKFDEELIPSAKNEELRSMLTATRTKIEGHLNHAKEIRTSL